MKRELHVGVYGVIENEGRILVVKKARGPYLGLFDLPGGRPEHGEPLLEALQRELREETGIEARQFSLRTNLSFLVPYKNRENIACELHHIALIYLVEDAEFTNFKDTISQEDVSGACWLAKSMISKAACSPLLLSACERF